jgi:hypothetical protein
MGDPSSSAPAVVAIAPLQGPDTPANLACREASVEGPPGADAGMANEAFISLIGDVDEDGLKAPKLLRARPPIRHRSELPTSRQWVASAPSRPISAKFSSTVRWISQMAGCVSRRTGVSPRSRPTISQRQALAAEALPSRKSLNRQNIGIFRTGPAPKKPRKLSSCEAIVRMFVKAFCHKPSQARYSPRSMRRPHEIFLVWTLGAI